MIMGGGRIAVHLTRLLMESGIAVTIVEADRTRCEELCDLVPGARIICGDATRGDILLEEGIKSSDAFVALTGDDGDNIITSIYAKQSGVGKIVVKVNREYYSDILESSGIDCVVTPKTLISQQLARYVRAMSNFKVAEGSACVGIPLKTLRLKPNIIISALVRGSSTIIPDGETVIQPGDHAVIVTRAGRLKELDSIVEGR